MRQALWGALSISSFITSLFFLRFWRLSRDRFFVFFFLAFLSLGLNWIWLACIAASGETQHYAYVIRLVAFLMIIFGILDKNRRELRR